GPPRRTFVPWPRRHYTRPPRACQSRLLATGTRPFPLERHSRGWSKGCQLRVLPPSGPPPPIPPPSRGEGQGGGQASRSAPPGSHSLPPLRLRRHRHHPLKFSPTWLAALDTPNAAAARWRTWPYLSASGSASVFSAITSGTTGGTNATVC